MCVNHPEHFHSDTPIIAYKVMRTMRALTPQEFAQVPHGNISPENFHRHGILTEPSADGVVVIQSICAGNDYVLGEQYDAGVPHYDHPKLSTEYGRGFHAYKNLEDALLMDLLYHDENEIVVKVELTDVVFKGTEMSLPVYVANKCKFLEIVEPPCA